jgi:hypothetical protein
MDIYNSTGSSNSPNDFDENLVLLVLIKQAIDALNTDGRAGVITYGDDGTTYATELFFDRRELIFRFKGAFDYEKKTCDDKHYQIIAMIMSEYMVTRLRLVMMPNGKSSAVPILIDVFETPPKDRIRVT